MKTLLAFLLGVLLTTGVCLVREQGINRRWEWDAYNRGYGYFTYRVVQRDHWTFHWFDRPAATQPRKVERIKI